MKLLFTIFILLITMNYNLFSSVVGFIPIKSNLKKNLHATKLLNNMIISILNQNDIKVFLINKQVQNFNAINKNIKLIFKGYLEYFNNQYILNFMLFDRKTNNIKFKGFSKINVSNYSNNNLFYLDYDKVINKIIIDMNLKNSKKNYYKILEFKNKLHRLGMYIYNFNILDRFILKNFNIESQKIYYRMIKKYYYNFFNVYNEEIIKLIIPIADKIKTLLMIKNKPVNLNDNIFIKPLLCNQQKELNIALLFDNTFSLKEQIKLVKNKINNLIIKLKALYRKNKIKIAIITNTRNNLHFTDNLAKINKFLNELNINKNNLNNNIYIKLYNNIKKLNWTSCKDHTKLIFAFLSEPIPDNYYKLKNHNINISTIKYNFPINKKAKIYTNIKDELSKNLRKSLVKNNINSYNIKNVKTYNNMHNNYKINTNINKSFMGYEINISISNIENKGLNKKYRVKKKYENLKILLSNIKDISNMFAKKVLNSNLLIDKKINYRKEIEKIIDSLNIKLNYIIYKSNTRKYKIYSSKGKEIKNNKEIYKTNKQENNIIDIIFNNKNKANSY